MRNIKTSLALIFLGTFCFYATLLTAETDKPEKMMLVFDASGSMWGQVDGRTKIEIAREAVVNLIDGLSKTSQVGLIAYGHRKKGDCADIEELIGVGAINSDQFKQTVFNISPKGKTPLVAAVKEAATKLKYTEDKATVVLISDGIETCQLDPCLVGKELQEKGLDFTAHVIGFALATKEDQKGLRCLAESTGGQFVLASNAQELQAALSQVTEVKAEPSATPSPMPEATILAPKSATKGTIVQVVHSAGAVIDPAGYLYIYKKGVSKHNTYSRVTYKSGNDFDDTEIRLPGIAGEYELVWKDPTGIVLASADIEATEASIKIDTKDEIGAATEFKVKLEAPAGLSGYIYLHKSGNEQSISYARPYENAQGGYETLSMKAPAQVGDYYLEWRDAGNVLSKKEIRVVPVEISLQGPDSVPMSTSVKVTLIGPEQLSGYLYLLREGREQSITYTRLTADNLKGGYKPAELKVPADIGNYQVVYRTNSNEDLAVHSIQVVEAPIAISGPAKVKINEDFSVDLQGPAGITGYVYLHRAGNEKSITYKSVYPDAIKDYQSVKFAALQEVGKYELRWINSYKETLALHNFEIIDEQSLGDVESLQD